MRHLLAAFALLALGCAAGEETSADGSAASVVAQYTALAEQAGSVAQQLRTTLEEVRDAESAAASARTLPALVQQVAALDAAYSELPRPSDAEQESLAELPAQQSTAEDWSAINSRLLALAAAEPPYYGCEALRAAVQDLPCVSLTDRKNTILAMHAAARELIGVLNLVTDAESAEAAVPLVSLLINKGLELEAEYDSYPAEDEATADAVSAYLEALSYTATMDSLGSAAAALLSLPSPCYGCSDLADLLTAISGS